MAKGEKRTRLDEIESERKKERNTPVTERRRKGRDVLARLSRVQVTLQSNSQLLLLLLQLQVQH